MQTLSPVAAAAVRALAPFEPQSRAEVIALLEMWRHRDTLTEADRRAILLHYRNRRNAGGGK